MSTCRDLRLYIQILHALGMMCCHLDEGPSLLRTTPRCERYALSYTMGVMATSLACFAYAHLEPQRFYMLIYNRTGNFYETVNFRCTCLVLVLLYVCLYLRRRRHVSLVQILLSLNRESLSTGLDRRFLNNLILYGVLLLLCFGNYLNGYSHSGLSTFVLTIYVLVNTYAFVVLCLLLVFFVCLKQIMAGGLLHYNQQLMLGFARPKYIMALRERQKLLALCAGELNECFGLLMLPIVALVLLKMPSGPFYLISTVMEGQYGDSVKFAVMFLTASFWDVPWLVIMILMLRTNGITLEANKTAKILSKIPRTGSGLDRMVRTHKVEKFLLKNLRQQPILTAYGFFALDKSTLFNLFTAIFTYMVILVQFKEMENSTKAIHRGTAAGQQNFTQQ